MGVSLGRCDYLGAILPNGMNADSREALPVSANDPECPFAVPGSVLVDKFRIDRVLGRGGMGVVVAATHIQLDQQVALKFLLPAACAVPSAAARFLQEARAAARMRGEHIGRVMDVSTLPDGTPYMVMELLEGEDLSDLLAARGKLPISGAIGLILQACEAVAEAHSLGIVHRDLKPANLFLTHRPDGSPLLKVLDFGISKSLGHTSSNPSLTGTAVVMGSPLYMSPEQVRSSRDVDTRTDVWSLGIILHELLTGSPPFLADSTTALLVQIAVEPPVPLREVRPDAPPELEQVLLRCFEKDPNRRIQTVTELARLLAPFATFVGSSVTMLDSTGAPPGLSPARTGPEGSTVAGWGKTGQRMHRSVMARILVGAGVVVILAILGGVVALRTATQAVTAAPVSAVSPAVSSVVIPAADTPPPVEVVPQATPSLHAESSASPAVVASTSALVRPRTGGPGARPQTKPQPSRTTQVGGPIDPLDGRR
jgi:serine/threonine-protein kinase